MANIWGETGENPDEILRTGDQAVVTLGKLKRSHKVINAFSL
jgi:hypothetical protein